MSILHRGMGRKRIRIDNPGSTRFSLDEIRAAKVRMIKARNVLNVYEALNPDDQSKKHAVLVKGLKRITAAFELASQFLPEHQPEES